VPIRFAQVTGHELGLLREKLMTQSGVQDVSGTEALRLSQVEVGKCEHSWTVRYWDDGRQREKSFKRNYKEAVRFSKTIEADKLDIHRGDPEPPITFGKYAEGWLQPRATGPVNTTRSYGTALRLNLLPVFGADS
jgi:hypothetical protein